MQTASKRWTKKPFQEPRDRRRDSALLRDIGAQLNRRDFAGALAAADRELQRCRSDRVAQSRYLGLVGDSAFKRGQFEEAARFYTAAASKGIAHHRHWLRPIVGQVRSLILAGRLEEAHMMAEHACAVAGHKEAAFTSLAAHAGKMLREEGALRISPRPPRVSVVAARMGALFLQEGELDTAEGFFQRARASSPGGACRACQGLARIALAKGDPAHAFTLAASSLRNGRFAVKTLASWPLLIRARARLGGWQISERLIAGLKDVPASVRARATLVIVTELRNHDMRQWQKVARQWLAQEGKAFPIIAAELNKMVVASAERDGRDAGARKTAAGHLLAVPGLSAMEWLAATKTRVRAQLETTKKPFPVEAVIEEAILRFGPGFAARTRHGLALALIKAGQDDMARSLLEAALQQGTPGRLGWGKSAWTLARLELRADRAGQAADLFRRYAACTDYPERFRLQALVEGVKALARVGNPPIDEGWRDMVRARLAACAEVDVVLDVARHLRLVDRALAGEVFARGEAMALQAIRQAEHPAVRLDLLFRLTRRQVGDFGRCRPAVQYWESLDQAQRDQLWSEKEQYWEYLAFLYEAYLALGWINQAEGLVQGVLADPATPALGHVHLESSRAEWLMRQKGRAAEAIAAYRRAIRAMPHHKRCAQAYLWEALLAYRQGDGEAVARAARRIRDVQGVYAGMRLDRILEAKGRLLEAGLEATLPGLAPAEQADYEEYRQQLVEDLALLGGVL